MPTILHRTLGILIGMFFFLCFSTVQTAYAGSPPNLTTNLIWTDSGGSGNAAAFGGVADIELAFNNARRQEEVQLGLPANQLGLLDLPAQAQWDALSMDQRALFLLNAERMARTGMKTGVLGLPFAAIESNLDKTAQTYAELLITSNTFGHYQPSGNPATDNPSIRISQTPVIKNCYQFISRAENLAAFWSSRVAPIPLVLERAIYGWIYVDSASQWGHREAALLQDVGLSVGATGFTNNVGDARHEGFLAIGHHGGAGYNPSNLAGMKYGEVVVMMIVDPVAKSGCPTDAGLTSVTTALRSPGITTFSTGQTFSLTLTLTNTGAAVLTNVALTTTLSTNYVSWLNATIAPTSYNVATGQLTWQALENSAPRTLLQPGEALNLTFYLTARKPTPVTKVLTSVAAARGSWGGVYPATPNTFQAQVSAPLLNEVAYAQTGNLHEEFIEIYNPTALAINLTGYAVDLVDGAGSANVYQSLSLPAVVLAPGDYFVLCSDAQQVFGCDWAGLALNNPIHDGGPAALALRYTDATGSLLVDALSYTGDAPLPYREGSGVGLSDDPALPLAGLARYPNGGDTNQNNVDWGLRCATSGRANQAAATNCSPDLVLTQQVTPTAVAPGQAVTYTLRYSNIGIACALPLTLTTALPAYFSNITMDWQGSPLQYQANSQFTWTAQSLCPGDSGVIQLHGVVKTPLAVGLQLSNQSEIRTPFPELTLTNNQTTASVLVTNVAPAAVFDPATTPEDTAVTIPVLSNDSDLNGDSFVLSAVETPAHGMALIDGATVRYTPVANFNGSESFAYTVRDSNGATSSGTVNVTVTPVNDPPLFASTPLTFTFAGQPYVHLVQAQDVDAPEQLVLTLVEGPTWLTLVDQGNGAARLQGVPTDAQTGNYTIHLRVTDSAGAVADQQFVLTVVAAPHDKPGNFLYLPLLRR